MLHSRKNEVTPRDQLIHAVDGELTVLRACGQQKKILSLNEDGENIPAQEKLLAVLVDIHFGVIGGTSAKVQLQRAKEALAAAYDDATLADKFEALVNRLIIQFDPSSKAATPLARAGNNATPVDQKVNHEQVEQIIAGVTAAYAAHTQTQPDDQCKTHIATWLHLQLHDRLPLHDAENINKRAQCIDATHRLVTMSGFTLADFPAYENLLTHMEKKSKKPISVPGHAHDKASGGGRGVA